MISYEELSLVFDMENPLALEYFELVDKHTEEPKYIHKHHILPKSVWPEYKTSEWNIVKLHYKHHYRVHEILPFICLQEQHKHKMANAWTLMGKFKEYTSPDETLWDELYRLQVESKLGARNPNYGKSPSAETRAKTSKSSKGHKKPDSMRIKLAIAKTGTKMPREAVERSNAANRGRVPTDAARENMRKGQLGRKLSDETRRKQSDWHIGRPRSPETVAKRKATILAKSLKNFLEYLTSNTNLTMVGEYVEMSHTTMMKCNLCYHEFPRSPSMVKRSHRCPNCKT